ncbi:MAG: ATP-binding protein [Spirulinaceae cyanobacterium]
MSKPAIICVDDERIVLVSLRDQLTQHLGNEYDIELAESGEEALEVFAELTEEKVEVPLIISDQIMPGMKGDDLLVVIQNQHPQTLKIMLTGQASAEAVGKAVNQANLYRYITKPWQAEDLKLTVKEALNSYEQKKKLAEYSRTLEKKVEERTTELQQKNQELAQTLQELQATQQELIQSEKMAALGQLIAGVAHEINTPLGAIKASISNIANALAKSLQQLPQLLTQLSQQEQEDFFALIAASQNNIEPLSFRAERKIKRAYRQELQEQNIQDADTVAANLVKIGFRQELAPFLSLLKSPYQSEILHNAYNLSMQQSNSENIKLAVDRASKIVFALKSYARQGQTGEKIRSQVIEGIDLVLTIYHNQLKRGIDVTENYQDIPPILCYPEELNQVWTNLIHNAIQAMNNKGRLGITALENNGYIVVQITDSGCGIPPQIKENIFKPFFTTKSAGEGSGLGLDIVSKIIDKHQGKIEVESKTGCTTFKVWLPIS